MRAYYQLLMHSDPQIDIDAKLAFLSRPFAYSDASETVEIIETHFAWVFLSRTFVHKLKKPVRFRDLDTTTLAARRANCELEVSLNRRLAADVYLGVVPLVRRGESLALEGAGEVVDWLVKMRRLPRELMLDYAGVRSTVADAEIDLLIDKLADYYRRAPRAPWDGDGYRQALLRRIAGDAAELEALDVPFDKVLLRDVVKHQTAFIREHAQLLDERVGAGRVVDAHGDLRPEHVCLGAQPQIIDCLEFSAALRLLDSAEEIAFLTPECDAIGCAPVGRRIRNAYVRRMPDPQAMELLDFYQSARAVVRALLAAWRMRDYVSEARRIRSHASLQWYLREADRAIRAARSRQEVVGEPS